MAFNGGTIGAKISAGWKNTQGKQHDSHSAEHDADQMAANNDAQYGQNQIYSGQIADTDKKYLGTMQGNVNSYQFDLDHLKQQEEQQQKDTQNTYSNDIQPRMKDLMETAQKNASNAMSLKDSMDPNNSVATATRKLYSDQAQNEGRSGLASAATLQALGAQNFGTQLGGAGPMTGGQMAALMGQNQAASSAAYGNTQKRMQDLQDQGLTQGFNRSDIAYNNGQQALSNYGQSVGNFEGAMDRQNNRDADFRGQSGDYAGKTYSLQQQMADANRGVANAGTQRDMSIYNTYMGGNQANVAADIGNYNAQQAAGAQQTTAGTTAVGTVAAAYFGGPGAAPAGAKAGQAVGDAAAPSPYAIPQYGNYNSPYTTSAPTNYVSQGSANPTYGGVNGVYGDAGGSYPSSGVSGLNLADDYPQRPTMASSMARR